MGKLLDIKGKIPKKHPIIEIIGNIDIGKTPVAQLVARRLKATYIPFPVLDPTSLTGRGLLTTLTQNARELERNPHWWSHIYSANMYEQVSRIEEANESGPVVVTNYTMAYRMWMKTLGVNIENFTAHLPEPNVAYVLYGEQIVPTSRPIFNFSSEYIQKIKRNVAIINDPRVKKLVLSDFYSLYRHVYVNNICVAITTNVKEKYGCYVDEKELYSLNSFIMKKDG